MTHQARFPGMDFAADVEESLYIIRKHEPPEGYYGLFSGGKDSVALKELARQAGVKVDWHYNLTTIDPPELVRFIRREHPDVEWTKPRHGNFFRRAAEKKGFPTRIVRWCCDEYKESTNPTGRVLLMGIRAQESAARSSGWGLVSTRRRISTLAVNPLYLWEAEDLWDYIHSNGVAYSELYHEGFHRLGCIGCPMARYASRRHEFDRWPKYEERWKYVFRRTWERRTGSTQRGGRPWFGDAFFSRWEEMWHWWLHDVPLPRVTGYPLLDGVLHEEMP